jgi:hypothetical protein
MSATLTDATALLAGTWNPNQWGQATVYVDAVPETSPELEIRLRSSISAHVDNGYEVSFQVGGGLAIVRWNGPVASFDYITTASMRPLVTGDVIYAQVSGNVITAKLNTTTIATANITSIGGTVYSTGNPGMGHDHFGPLDGTQTQYGFTAFSAGEL